MTETQQKLMPYVEARVGLIIAQKGERDIRPLIATEPEIVTGIREDVIECMRELHRNGCYVATNTINSPALMRKEVTDEISEADDLWITAEQK